MLIIGIVLVLIGGAMIETPIIGCINGEVRIFAVLFGIFCGALFLVPGIYLITTEGKKLIKKRREIRVKDILEAFRPGFKEATERTGDDRLLLSFREHYSRFLMKEKISENEKIQEDVTQIFRNILQFQKSRLLRLGITCEMLVKRMKYTTATGVTRKEYSDGKYNITEVKEEVAARTIYRKDGKELFTKIDRDVANYTIVRAKKVGDKKVICPNCGAEMTREELLDGCDYCGTTFAVEDLGSKVAVFAFRPDDKLRYERYLITLGTVVLTVVSAAILAVFLGFTVYGILHAKDLLIEADGGIILTILGTLFAIVVASPFYIIAFLIVYWYYILPVLLACIWIAYRLIKKIQKVKDEPFMDREWEEKIRRVDPYFSIANFYSGVQNKISAILYAENERQIQAFAEADLTKLLGKFSNVVGIDVNHMKITDYRTDQKLQYAKVEAYLILTRYTGKKCVVRNEKLTLCLAKSLECRTQAVCAPAVLTCKGCGHSLDLLQGKACPFCQRELDMKQYDWVITEVHT